MDTSTSLLFVVVAAIAIAVTVLLCRHMVARGRAVRWWLTGVGIVIAAFLGLLFVTVPDILKRDIGKMPPILSTRVVWVAAGVLLMGASLVWMFAIK